MMQKQHRIEGGKIPPDVPHTAFKMHLKQAPAGICQLARGKICSFHR